MDDADVATPQSSICFTVVCSTQTLAVLIRTVRASSCLTRNQAMIMQATAAATRPVDMPKLIR